MEGIILIIALVFGVLNIILFFKVWGMTNDVSLMTSNVSAILNIMRKASNIQKTAEGVKEQTVEQNPQEVVGQRTWLSYSNDERYMQLRAWQIANNTDEVTLPTEVDKDGAIWVKVK